jgi:hypothetical protein
VTSNKNNTSTTKTTNTTQQNQHNTTNEDQSVKTSHHITKTTKMKVSHYLRAQNFAAPSVNDNDSHKKSFRQNDDEMQMLCTNNIMFDSRVCRGNTYATPVFTEDQRRNQEVYERTQNARRSLIERQNNEVCACTLYACVRMHIYMCVSIYLLDSICMELSSYLISLFILQESMFGLIKNILINLSLLVRKYKSQEHLHQ